MADSGFELQYPFVIILPFLMSLSVTNPSSFLPSGHGFID
jgi:hypothetical protein